MPKIMIVDDNPDIIIAIRELFEPEGFEVYACNSGWDCIEELERGFKGIILMDVMMPVMNGWETIGEIVNRGYHKGNIISMLTIKPESTKNPQYEKYIKDYLKKPFDSKNLINTVKGYID